MAHGWTEEDASKRHEAAEVGTVPFARSPAPGNPLAGLMPRYLCHKVVEALEIERVEPGEEGGALYLKCPNGLTVRLTCKHALMARRVPVPGDFYVVYDGGKYDSVSPAAEFAAGYSEIGKEV